MNNMDSMNDGPDDTNDIGDMSAFLDWTFASTLEPTDSQISTFVGNGYGALIFAVWVWKLHCYKKP